MMTLEYHDDEGITLTFDVDEVLLLLSGNVVKVAVTLALEFMLE